MSDIKDKIKADLEKAKQEGKLRSERIREIVRDSLSQAINEAVSEIKEGAIEIRSLVKDALNAVVESLKDKGGEIQEEVTASIEGAIEGISLQKRKQIAGTQAELKQLQAQIDTETEELNQQIDDAIAEIEDTGSDTSADIKAAISSAVSAMKDSEEVALMQKRYAQLKAQLAIIDANLASRYGERYEDIKGHLDEAKTWYDRAKTEPEVFTEQVKQKQTEFENKLGEAGSAIAKKERQIKQLLKELWQSLTDIFRDNK